MFFRPSPLRYIGRNHRPSVLALYSDDFIGEVRLKPMLNALLDRNVIDDFQIADRDTIAPPPGARAAAWRAKGKVEVREYPCEHFDIYLGDAFERTVSDQIDFLHPLPGLL